MTDNDDTHDLVDQVLLAELRLLVDVMIAATQLEERAGLAELDTLLGVSRTDEQDPDGSQIQR